MKTKSHNSHRYLLKFGICFDSLKTNICDEQVCSRETSGTTLTPEHSSPHCVAEWGMRRFSGQVNGFENLNCRRGPRSLFACPLHPPHPNWAKQGKGTALGDQRIVALVSLPQTMIITNVRLSCLSSYSSHSSHTHDSKVLHLKIF